MTEELSEIDRRIIGGNRRVSIPMETRQIMSETLDVMRGLCNDIEHALQTPGLDTRGLLWQCGGAIDAYQRKLAGICAAHGVKIREGRPTNAERFRDQGMIRRVK